MQNVSQAFQLQYTNNIITPENLAEFRMMKTYRGKFLAGVITTY